MMRVVLLARIANPRQRGGVSSSIGGSIGGATDNVLAPYLNTSTEEVLMQIGTSLPANFLEKGGNKVLIDKVK